MNINWLYERISPFFRRKRMERFWTSCRVNTDSLVLDVGGTEFNWTLAPEKPRLVLLNRRLPPAREHGVRYVVGDGTLLPFRAASIPVVFSNSVIEHVGNREDRQQFAREIERVGNSFFVQTPSKNFPIEPHLIAPFIHWLPKRLEARLPWLSLRGWLSRRKFQELVREVHLLTESEFRELFPTASIHRERVLGIKKSFVAIRSPAFSSDPSSRRN